MQFLKPLFFLAIVSCGATPTPSSLEQAHGNHGHHTPENQAPCVERYHGEQYVSLPQMSATLDADGYAQALNDEGNVVFEVKQTWQLFDDALAISEAKNIVNFEVRLTDGSLPESVHLTNFYPMMDMGAMAHSTNMCHQTHWTMKVNSEFAHIIQVEQVNFIMGARTPDRWFLHNLTFVIDGIEGKVERFLIPHKVK